jgi:hypothetical protein
MSENQAVIAWIVFGTVVSCAIWEGLGALGAGDDQRVAAFLVWTVAACSVISLVPGWFGRRR